MGLTITRELSARARNPHRHRARAAKDNCMAVSIDGEGRSDADGSMSLITMSYGREDGTSATVFSSDPIVIINWLIDQLSGHYVDANGKDWRQALVAFHFNFDHAVLTKIFDVGTRGMMLIHRSGGQDTTERDLLCGVNHDKRKCLRQGTETDRKVWHKYDKEQIELVITEGGETKLLAYDKASHLAVACTPNRRFVAEHRPKGGNFKGNFAGWRGIDVHDTGRAFAGGLESVIDDWQPELTVEQRAIIAWGKASRKSGFIEAPKERVAAYSEAECVAHARVVRQLVNAIREASGVPIKVGEVFGAGSIASKAFQHHGLAKNPAALSDKAKAAASAGKFDVIHTGGAFMGHEIDDLAQLTYFGGEIETPVIGLVKGVIDEEDIASAYPHKMVTLPCMVRNHGVWAEWRPRDGRFDPKKLGITEHTIGHALVSWDMYAVSTPPFMVRSLKTGNVAKPEKGVRVWVSMPELLAASNIHGKIYKLTRHAAVWWRQTCACPPPFRWIEHLYAKRKDVKSKMKEVASRYPEVGEISAQIKKLERKNPHHGDLPELNDKIKAILSRDSEWRQLNCLQAALKLVMNSSYGKLAQRRPTIGAHTNLHYASHITGATRAQVNQRTWERERSYVTVNPGEYKTATVVYQHTDSVLSIGAPKIYDEGHDLGAWELEKPSKDLLIMQPGLAIALGGGKSATRGVAKSDLRKALDQWVATTDLAKHPVDWPSIPVVARRMISRKAALARGKIGMSGAFITNENFSISFVSNKRCFKAAMPMPGCPTAWIIPPCAEVEDPVTDIAGIRIVQNRLIQEQHDMMVACRGEDMEDNRGPVILQIAEEEVDWSDEIWDTTKAWGVF